MKRLLLAACIVLIAGCATMSPEAVLLKGYQTASATVRSTTALVGRDAVSVTDAQNVHTLGTTAKATLDQGKIDLANCRAAEAAAKDTGVAAPKCDTISNINLGAGVLQQLETYLKAYEGSK